MRYFVLGVLMALVSGVSASPSVPESAQAVCPIKVGQNLPGVQVQDLDGKSVALDKIVTKKPTIFIFYRGSWCPYCNVHLGELKTIEDELLGLGYQIYGVSPDLPVNLKKSVEKHEMAYGLLSDSKAEAAKALGLAFRLDDTTYKKYLDYKIDLEAASGENHHILPVPAAIIVGKDGVVDFVFVSPDYKVRVDTSVLLAAAKAAMK